MKTESILLDLGVVMLHLDYDKAMGHILDFCPPDKQQAARNFLTLLERDASVHEYERGHISAGAFFEHFRSATGFFGTFDDFYRIWRSIFRENEPMIAFANELAKKYPIYFLTNASDMHVPWVFERFPRLRFYKEYVCSCYIKALKPEALFYERAMAQLNIDPAKSLFIDDRPENVAGALACGIPTVLYTNAEATILAVTAHLERTDSGGL